MKKQGVLLLCLLFLTPGLWSQASIEGKILDGESKSDMGLFPADVVLYKNDKFVQGTQTNWDGNYVFNGLEMGTYDLVVSSLGYEAKKVTGIIVNSGTKEVVNVRLSVRSSVLLDEIIVTEYKAPLIQQDNTTRGKTMTAAEIRALPTKDVSAIAATSVGIAKSDRNDDVSIRDSRSDATNFYVDGVRVSSSKIPASEIDMIGSSPFTNAPKDKRAAPPHDPRKVGYQTEDHFYDNEAYQTIVENIFMDPMDEALSTFSIDVDRASYANVRRFLDNGQMPPADAVRIEELINYFDYTYEQPKGDDPMALHSTLVDCPWNTDHKILHLGLQGKKIDTEDLPPSNLVFLIDVSGSMNSLNKLPLVKASFKLLLNNLRPEDRVAIVTYAGRAGLLLESTPASDKQKILSAIESLGAGGSTAGAEGMLTAYEVAKKNFIKKGNNRVILATDGDFNVGLSDNSGLEKMIEKKRKEGVFLSVLGYGMGNYKDDKMEILADKGNGNHAYIDNIQEARKVLINEFGGTLFTIAKDVKLQIEFNPGHVQAYRLIGYENRLLNKEDFNDDTKDAGELGAGHVVTAMYEIIPVGVESSFAGSVDALKYQGGQVKRPEVKHSDELATIKFRYKQPDGNKSKKIISIIAPKSKEMKDCSEDLRFSLAVAEFGMILRGSSFINTGSYSEVIKLAEKAKGNDEEGYRAEFVRLVKTVEQLQGEIVEK